MKTEVLHWRSWERGIFDQRSVVSSTQESCQKKEMMSNHSRRHLCWCQGFSSPDSLKFSCSTVSNSESLEFHRCSQRRRAEYPILCQAHAIQVFLGQKEYSRKASEEKSEGFMLRCQQNFWTTSALDRQLPSNDAEHDFGSPYTIASCDFKNASILFMFGLNKT